MTDPTPLLLIPGLNCTGELFAGQVPRLSARTEVTIVDHRTDDSIAAIAARALAAAPPRFAVAGLSMGGYVAMEILARAPERVTRAALIDTTARPDTPEAAERRRRLIALAEKGGFDEVPGLQLPMLLGRRAAAGAEIPQIVRRMAAETGAEAFVRQQRAILGRRDFRPVLGAVTCPVLVVVGEEDQITPPEVARELAGAIAGAALEIVPDAGHLSTLEAPERLTELLAGFLLQRE